MDNSKVSQSEIDEMEGLFHVGVEPVELDDHVSGSSSKKPGSKTSAGVQEVALLPLGTVSSSDPESGSRKPPAVEGFGPPPNTLTGIAIDDGLACGFSSTYFNK